MTRIFAIGLAVVLGAALVPQGAVPAEAPKKKSQSELPTFLALGDSIPSGKKKGLKAKGSGKSKSGLQNTERELVDALSESRRNSPTVKTPALKRKMGGQKLD